MGLTQEDLADRLGVTRQAVSRWEQDLSFPETKQLIELCRLFGLTADDLLFGERPLREERQEAAREETPTDARVAKSAEEEEGAEGAESAEGPADDGKGRTWGVIDHGRSLRFEYISRRRVLGMPLVHINFGACRAHGFFAVGLFSAGIFSLGLFSMGVFSAGIFALGLLAFGSFALGGASFGGVALGLLAFGGIACGLFAVGGFAVGQLAIGGAAVGQFAMGDWAHGWLAVGISHADGAHPFLVTDGLEELSAFLGDNVAPWLGELMKSVASVLRR